MKRPFCCYAVSRGKVVGVFDKWPAVAASVRGYGPAARYRGFYSRQDAEDWLLDERARIEEARRGRKKGKAEDGSTWHFVPATEPLQGPVIPEWPTWQGDEQDSGRQ